MVHGCEAQEHDIKDAKSAVQDQKEENGEWTERTEQGRDAVKAREG
jgi:hypothetical protein